MSQTAGVPGKGWYWLAGTVALASILAVAGLIAWAVVTYDEGHQFLAPGRQVLELGTGRHVVWNDYRTIFEGRSFDASRTLPSGVEITVTEVGSGRPVALRRAGSSTFTSANTERAAVVEFETARPGRFEIAVQGNFPPRVFSVGPDMVRLLLLAIFGSLGLLFAGWGVAGAIAVWVYICRDQAMAAGTRAAAAAAPGDARIASLKRITAIVYALQIASLLVGITFIAAVIINYVKRAEVAGTWLESHFRWQIRTFWYTLLWTCIGIALLIVVIGLFILMASVVWMLYRAIRGWLALEEGKTLPA